MRPRVKYHVIHMNRDRYSICAMCRFFGVSRSGYYDFVHRLGHPEKDTDLADIIREQQKHCYRTYGYRRMWLWLKKRGIYRLKPKTISEARKAIDVYIYFYNHERIQLKMGVAPLALRHSA